MSIEERAYKQYPPHQNAFTEELRSKGRAGYIKGARAQRDIDIEKACEWLTDYFVFKHEAMSGQGCNAFLEEFRNAMKGE